MPGEALGGALKDVTGWSDSLDTAWSVGRWPLGAALVAFAVALLFNVSPNRRQPDISWLAVGSVITIVLWFTFTGLLALYVSVSTGFGETTGRWRG